MEDRDPPALSLTPKSDNAQPDFPALQRIRLPAMAAIPKLEVRATESSSKANRAKSSQLALPAPSTLPPTAGAMVQALDYARQLPAFAGVSAGGSRYNQLVQSQGRAVRVARLSALRCGSEDKRGCREIAARGRDGVETLGGEIGRASCRERV